MYRVHVQGGGSNRSRSIECQSQGGMSSCQCPVLDRCAFWDKGTRQWSSQGCRMLASPEESSLTRCSCNHLTTFTVLAETADFILVRTEYIFSTLIFLMQKKDILLPACASSVQATAAMSKSITRETIEKSLGLVLFLGALYATFVIGLVVIRYRRTRESLAYLK